jgi:hypothetical protein
VQALLMHITLMEGVASRAAAGHQHSNVWVISAATGLLNMANTKLSAAFHVP